MCGLYSNRKMAAEVKSIFGYAQDPPFAPRDYIIPGGPMEIIKGDHGTPHFGIVRWGLVPGWAKEIRTGKPLINARAETVLQKPSFSGGMKHRRCLIPADGYFEWQGDISGKKQPWYFTRPDQSLFAFAGIWEQWMSAEGSELESAAIITTSANSAIAPIHHRMPVVIEPQNYAAWLDTDTVMALKAAELLLQAPDDYFKAEKTTINRGPNKKEIKEKEIKGKENKQLKLF